MALLPPNRQARIALVLGSTVLGLVGLTVPFWIWPIDLEVGSSFYEANDGWLHSREGIWSFFYHFGTLPAVVSVIGALIVLGLSFSRPDWVKWRKLSLYLVLCLIVGPGLLVNAIFKDHWGRPRPREVQDFGGQWAHEQVWEYDATSPGKSFPCGHCSMGFYFFAVALALRERRRLAWMAAGGAAVFGTLIGMARVAQGGHFLSDVLWAGGFCLLTSLGLFYALALDRSLFYVPKSAPDRLAVPWWGKLLGGGLGTAIVAAVLVATPYQQNQTYRFASGTEPFELSMVLEGSRHDVRLAEGEGRVVLEGNGFGLPGSAVKNQVRLVSDDPKPGESYFQIKQRQSGWFSELRQFSSLQVPSDREGYVKLVVRSGELRLDLGDLKAPQKWRVEVEGPGTVFLRRPAGSARELLDLHLTGGSVLPLDPVKNP